MSVISESSTAVRKSLISEQFLLLLSDKLLLVSLRLVSTDCFSPIGRVWDDRRIAHVDTNRSAGLHSPERGAPAATFFPYFSFLWGCELVINWDRTARWAKAILDLMTKLEVRPQSNEPPTQHSRMRLFSMSESRLHKLWSSQRRLSSQRKSWRFCCSLFTLTSASSSCRFLVISFRTRDEGAVDQLVFGWLTVLLFNY